MADYLLLNGQKIKFNDIVNEEVTINSPFEQSTFSFVKDWLSNKQTFKFYTSGSSGEPKAITVKRSQIEASINQTASFLKLKKNDSSLICLDTSKIAGIMMLSRGLYIGMEMTIISPTSTPLDNITSTFDFCALVPLQVKNSSNQKLSLIKKLIIGGGVIDKTLENRLLTLTNNTYHTYGMTETLSHVALREISPNTSKLFSFLPGVQFKIRNNNCLSIKSLVTENEWVDTNDIVDLNNNQFTWIGRIDNTINSGGYKINLDALQSKIQQLNPNLEFVLSSIPDPHLGDKLILVSLEKPDLKWATLDFYEIPKLLFKTNSFPLLASGKIDLQMIKKSIGSYQEW